MAQARKCIHKDFFFTSLQELESMAPPCACQWIPPLERRNLAPLANAPPPPLERRDMARAIDTGGRGEFFSAMGAVERHGFLVAVWHRLDPTAPVKSYTPVRGARSRKPPPRELDRFVVDITSQPASSTFGDALQPEGWTVQMVIHPDVAFSKNRLYEAGTALSFFFRRHSTTGMIFLQSVLLPSTFLRSAAAILWHWLSFG